ncbi:uncharacterized protein LOC129218558 [Uloborus diversus]|uniref:uncharacterized protein LOC129218558 n=1 Tax=Uloborus diversus TaxID=327109 RepID=UPI00240A3B0C|nr:uncharacterized protein LOC129218558 [Uloborus diversus]XP_054708836.1 uncharacterized protein LOC129218558 [Uloborus diversus]XP_054708837.1 uncharacterized protein LOC129218558 [Uloborus diversus]
MKVKLVACLFLVLESLMLAGQITTLVSTYWTSWDLRFNWTQSLKYSRNSPTDGQLVSQGHAGLWSRCFRVYDTSRNDPSALSFNCLNNYNMSGGPMRFSFGKACKTATAALCLGDSLMIFAVLIIVLVSLFKSNSRCYIKAILVLLLLQGLICFAIPLVYLSGNMSELIDQLSGAYGLLQIVEMSPGYTHDWAFWTQVGLFAIWIVAVDVFMLLYSFTYALSCPKSTRSANGRNEKGDSTELETLRS